MAAFSDSTSDSHVVQPEGLRGVSCATKKVTFEFWARNLVKTRVNSLKSVLAGTAFQQSLVPISNSTTSGFSMAHASSCVDVPCIWSLQMATVFVGIETGDEEAGVPLCLNVWRTVAR